MNCIVLNRKVSIQAGQGKAGTSFGFFTLPVRVSAADRSSTAEYTVHDDILVTQTNIQPCNSICHGLFGVSSSFNLKINQSSICFKCSFVYSQKIHVPYNMNQIPVYLTVLLRDFLVLS